MGNPDLHPRAAWIVDGARVCVGVRFRPQGRGIDGLDCLGVVIRAAANAGIHVIAPVDYALAGQGLAQAYAGLVNQGFRRLGCGEARAGDMLAKSPATRQVHFAICTGSGVVEAHLGMRRVIERPLSADDNWESAWRMPATGESDTWRL
ncbi:MAG: peptidoglycan endopeptidase [Sphingomonadaceae bacterium]